MRYSVDNHSVHSADVGLAPCIFLITADTTSDSLTFPSYLASSGALLREALLADAESTRKLTDALKIFGEMENKLRLFIKGELEKA